MLQCLFLAINGWERGDYLPTAAELLAGLGEEAPGEFEVEADEEGGGAADVAAVEIEDGADAEHDAAAEVGAEALHELLLLGGAEGYPDDIHPLLFQRGGDGGIVEILHCAEGERGKRHIGHGGIPGGDGGAEVGQGGIIRAEESHAVFPCPHDIAEDLGAAVLLPLYAIEPLEVEGYPATIADGEEGAIHRGAVGGIVMHHGEDVAIGHADVARTLCVYGLADVAMHSGGVEFVAYLEIGFHGGLLLDSAGILTGFVATEAAGFGVLGGSGRYRAERIYALRDALRQCDFPEGEEEDFHVEPDGNLAGVAEIPRDALAEGEIVSPADLGQTGDAGADAHAQGAGCAVEGVHLLRNPRAGADEGHVSLEDVEQLGKFIERGGAQESAHEGGALLIRQEIAFRIAGVAHGAEFNDAERFLFASDTLLQEEGVATLEEHKQNQDEQQQGRNSKQQEEREEEVAGSLARAFVESAGRRQLVQKFYFFGDFHNLSE